jgi:hypothetical protein
VSDVDYLKLAAKACKFHKYPKEEDWLLHNCGQCHAIAELLAAASPQSVPGALSEGVCALCSKCGDCTREHIHCRKCLCDGAGEPKGDSGK